MGQFYNIDGTAEINVHIVNSDVMYQYNHCWNEQVQSSS